VWTAYSQFRNAVQRDTTLSGVITGGGWIQPAGGDYGQTTPEDLDGNAIGTFAQVDFRFTVHELIRAT
jgi:hypothetical protein